MDGNRTRGTQQGGGAAVEFVVVMARIEWQSGGEDGVSS